MASSLENSQERRYKLNLHDEESNVLRMSGDAHGILNKNLINTDYNLIGGSAAIRKDFPAYRAINFVGNIKNHQEHL